jgi:hypothetical protein
VSAPSISTMPVHCTGQLHVAEVQFTTLHTHLSRAYSMLAMPTACCPALAACNAATLTRLARSAPEKPGVPRAMVCS